MMQDWTDRSAPLTERLRLFDQRWFERALDGVEEMSWPPAPLTAHPSLQRYALAARQLMELGRHSMVLPVPRRLSLCTGSPVNRSVYLCVTALSVRPAQGVAPYVGDPFHYAWRVAVEEGTNRWVASESWVVRGHDTAAEEGAGG